MFKLIKIQNSGVNVPELEKREKPYYNIVKAGEALIIEDGQLNSCPATSAPTYIAFAGAGEDTDTVVCYPVNSDMIFETTVNEDPAQIVNGSKVTIGKDDDYSSVCVTATTASGVATVVDKMDASKIGDKIAVKF